MLAVREKETLETGGAEKHAAFTIKANGEAFRSLIDGLYSNKIQSIVRELAANAFDSHKVFGNPAPFFVHQPTLLQPEFYVRDYGIGMCDDKVMNLYTTVFDSDKSHSNECVGQFGLGSKSPFAYTDSFHVTCYDGVWARLYCAGIAENGVPQITRYKSVLSSEPLGVKIGFAVEEKDFREFSRAINHVALGFDTVFESNAKIDGTLGTVALKGEGWTCYTESTLGGTWHVRQGCVIYPMDTTGGLVVPYDTGVRKYVIDCPIGTVEVTTSREHVSYKPRVIQYLQHRIDLILNDLPELLLKKVEDIDNVADFFDAISRIKPNFLKAEFLHGPTKLSSKTIPIDKPSCIIRAAWEPHPQRWYYHVQNSTTAQAPNPSPDPSKGSVYEIKDIAALLDPARETNDPFTPREHRRISRLLRIWLEKEGKTNGTFWLGLGWSDRFVELTNPNLIRVELTVDDLLGVVSKKRPKVVETSIRGLAVLLGDCADQKTVHKIEIAENAAWITADLYRRDGKALRALAKRFGVTTLYVASSIAYKRAQESGLPRLDAAIGAYLTKKVGLTWDDWCGLSQIIEDARVLPQIVAFAKALLVRSPASFKKLARTTTLPGRIVHHLQPYLSGDTLECCQRERRTQNLLNENEDHKPRALCFNVHVQELVKLKATLTEDSSSPAIRFLSSLNYASSKAQLDATTRAIIAVFRAIPTTKKWKDY